MTEEQFNKLIEFIELSIHHSNYPTHTGFVKLVDKEVELKSVLVDKK